jgi:transmembrane sensor
MMSDKTYSLLIKQLKGSLSPAEEAELQQWEQAHADNKVLADQMRLLWKKSAAFTPSVELNLEQDFQKVLSKIEVQQETEPIRISLYTRIKPALRIAAVFVVLLAALFVVRNTLFSEPELIEQFASSDEPQRVDLSDGSVVWLRKGASVSYPDDLKNNPRHIQLDGEAYFEVAHDPAHPFVVETKYGGTVEVLGTSFGVQTSQDETVVLVRTGKVNFTPNPARKGVFLTPGRRASYTTNTRQLHVGNALTFNALAWQTGGLEFIDTPMRQVVDDLSTFYGVEVELVNEKMADCTLTSPLNNRPIEEVLNTLKLSYQFKVESTANGFRLLGGTCQ